MANVFINDDTMKNIANSIRKKTGKSEKILPKNMPSEIESIQGGKVVTPSSGDIPFACLVAKAPGTNLALQITEFPKTFYTFTSNKTGTIKSKFLIRTSSSIKDPEQGIHIIIMEDGSQIAEHKIISGGSAKYIDFDIDIKENKTYNIDIKEGGGAGSLLISPFVSLMSNLDNDIIANQILTLEEPEQDEIYDL